MTATLHDDVGSFMISQRVPLRIRNTSNKLRRVNPNTFDVNYLFSEYKSVYEIMWKNMVQPGRTRMTIQYGAYTVHAFARQQSLCGQASMLRLNIYCLFIIVFKALVIFSENKEFL
jgi:hypothetical protein